MQKNSKRPLQERLFNDSNPEQLALLLSEWSGSPWTMKVGALIVNLNGLEQLALMRAKRKVHTGALHRALMPPTDEILETLNGTLQSAQFSCRLVLTAEGWKRQWRPVGRTAIGQDNYMLQLGLAMVVDLAASHDLALVRQCESCAEWFVASRNRSDNRFCCKVCRKTWHSKTEDGKDKNRQYVKGTRERGWQRRYDQTLHFYGFPIGGTKVTCYKEFKKALSKLGIRLKGTKKTKR